LKNLEKTANPDPEMNWSAHRRHAAFEKSWKSSTPTLPANGSKWGSKAQEDLLDCCQVHGLLDGSSACTVFPFSAMRIKPGSKNENGSIESQAASV
jgi:hypothetical protein